MKYEFPPLTYGVDDYHGRRGPFIDDPTNEPGTGYELEYFRGQWLERLSIINILDDEAADIEVIENEYDDEFRAKLGFGSDGSTLK